MTLKTINAPSGNTKFQVSGNNMKEFTNATIMTEDLSSLDSIASSTVETKYFGIEPFFIFTDQKKHSDVESDIYIQALDSIKSEKKETSYFILNCNFIFNDEKLSETDIFFIWSSKTKDTINLDASYFPSYIKVKGTYDNRDETQNQTITIFFNSFLPLLDTQDSSQNTCFGNVDKIKCSYYNGSKYNHFFSGAMDKIEVIVDKEKSLFKPTNGNIFFLYIFIKSKLNIANSLLYLSYFNTSSTIPLINRRSTASISSYESLSSSLSKKDHNIKLHVTKSDKFENFEKSSLEITFNATVTKDNIKALILIFPWDFEIPAETNLESNFSDCSISSYSYESTTLKQHANNFLPIKMSRKNKIIICENFKNSTITSINNTMKFTNFRFPHNQGEFMKFRAVFSHFSQAIYLQNVNTSIVLKHNIIMEQTWPKIQKNLKHFILIYKFKMGIPIDQDNVFRIKLMANPNISFANGTMSSFLEFKNSQGKVITIKSTGVFLINGTSYNSLNYIYYYFRDCKICPITIPANSDLKIYHIDLNNKNLVNSDVEFKMQVLDKEGKIVAENNNNKAVLSFDNLSKVFYLHINKFELMSYNSNTRTTISLQFRARKIIIFPNYKFVFNFGDSGVENVRNVDLYCNIFEKNNSLSNRFSNFKKLINPPRVSFTVKRIIDLGETLILVCENFFIPANINVGITAEIFNEQGHLVQKTEKPINFPKLKIIPKMKSISLKKIQNYAGFYTTLVFTIVSNFEINSKSRFVISLPRRYSYQGSKKYIESKLNSKTLYSSFYTGARFKYFFSRKIEIKSIPIIIKKNVPFKLSIFSIESPVVDNQGKFTVLLDYDNDDTHFYESGIASEITSVKTSNFKHLIITKIDPSRKYLKDIIVLKIHFTIVGGLIIPKYSKIVVGCYYYKIFI